MSTKAPHVNDDDPMIGREVIGQYRIERRIGVGGMGAVYLAQQISVSRPAVIKVLRSQLGGSSEGNARFAVEAKAVSSLNHPNIVTIYNYGEMEDGTLFLAMEYIAGETLAQRIERCGQLPADRAVHIAAQIARALEEAHAHGIIHRDLKPANVMLVERAGEPDFVKVLDFGTAKLDDTGLTSAGFVIGTPRYMSPEQLLGQPLDRRSDIYSTGIMLYEMLVGQTPFQSETPIGWLRQHVDVEPKPPSAVAKHAKIPPPLERVVLRALAKTPAERPASMEMFARELADALNAPIEAPAMRPRRRPLRAVAAFAKRLGQIAVALVLAACGLVAALGSGASRFVRVLGSGMRRLARGVGSGLRALALGLGSGARRFARVLGSGSRRFARALRSGTRALGSGTLRFARALGSGARTLVLAPPAYLLRIVRKVFRSMLATRRRRVAVVTLVMLVLAVPLVVALSPKIRSGLWPTIGKPKPTSSDRSKAKSGQRPTSRTPARPKAPAAQR